MKSLSRILSAAGNVAWTDVIVQARIKILSFNGTSSSYYAGLCARVADASDYYCVVLRDDGNLAIRGDIAGSSGSIGSSTSYGVVTGTWYTVELEVVGSTITASINGTVVLPKAGSSAITDSSVTHGGIAVIVDDAVAAFDDATLEQVWKLNVGSGFTAPPMTFDVNGKQYIAIASGPSPPVLRVYPQVPELKEMRHATVLYVFGL